MIIKSQFKHKIGELVINKFINDSKGFSHKIPFLVLKETSLEKYVIECREENKPLGVILKDDIFYEISID